MKVSEQALYIVGAIALTGLLYFGFDTKPSTQKALEKSRALTTKEFDIASLEKEVRPQLKEEETVYLETLEAQLQHVDQDSQRLHLQKQLSGFWFSLGEPILAGMYARMVAETDKSASSWSIAGTTYAAALANKEIGDKKLSFARDEALECFENAISLEPRVVDHRINQALCYIEAPLPDTPMKGIQMLAQLARDYPDSPLPPFHLARLALRTGQYERATERIEQALRLDPKSGKTACLAIEIYTSLGQADKADKLKSLCATKQ